MPELRNMADYELAGLLKQLAAEVQTRHPEADWLSRPLAEAADHLAEYGGQDGR